MSIEVHLTPMGRKGLCRGLQHISSRLRASLEHLGDHLDRQRLEVDREHAEALLDAILAKESPFFHFLPESAPYLRAALEVSARLDDEYLAGSLDDVELVMLEDVKRDRARQRSMMLDLFPDVDHEALLEAWGYNEASTGLLIPLG